MTLDLVQLRPAPNPPHPFGPYHPVPAKRKRGNRRWRKFKTDGFKVIRFTERKCVFTNGRWAGPPWKPFLLRDWQKQLIIDLFEMVPNTNPEIDREWIRRYTTAYITMGKKQGKTELAAALALYFLLEDGEQAPNIAAAASAERQADLVFNAAKTMAEESLALKPLLKTKTTRIEAVGLTNAYIQRVPANGGKLDGQNLSVAVCDELHEWLTPMQVKTHGMLRGATAAREQPMVLQITTAGFDRESICYGQFEYGQSVERGEVDDETFFFRAWMVHDDVDHEDLDALIPANPNYGVTVQRSFYAGELNHRKPNQMKRYYFNMWTTVDESWLPYGVWEAGNVGKFDIPKDSTCTIGWDASTKSDSTALALIWWEFPEDGSAVRVHVKIMIWARPLTPDGKPDVKWRPPMRAIQDQVRDWCKEFDVVAAGYDPTYITWEATDLEAEGLPMLDIPNSPSQMVPGTEAAWEMFVHGRLFHEGDPLFGIHIENSVPFVTRGGGEMLEKSARGAQNDSAIALLKGIRAWQKHEEEEPEGVAFWFPKDEDDE